MSPHPRIFIALALSLLALGCQPAGDPGRGPNPSQPMGSGDLPAAQAAQACLVTARDLDRNGYSAEAINEYERARQLDPSLTQISRRLAVLYDRKGNDARALDEYQAALAENPFDPDVLNDFGFYYVARNNGPEAERLLRLALVKDPKSERAWVNLGTALAEQRKYSEAYGAFAHVLPPAQAWNNLGMIQAQQGDLKLAVDSLTKAADADPSMVPTQAALRWARKRLISVDPPPGQ
jgi:Tfp pilus assembly protein PilF